MIRLVGAIVAAVAIVSPAAAQAPDLELDAMAKPAGHIGLTLAGPAGATLLVTEDDTALAEVTLDSAGEGALEDAGRWSCNHRLREFHAEGTAPDGTPLAADARVRTPSCAHRYELKVSPKRPRANTQITARVIDTFRLGGATAKVCAAGTCRKVRVKGRRGVVKFKVAGRGKARVKARVGGDRIGRKTIRIRRPRHLTLLATGDSMIQIVDGFLKQRLAPNNVTVRSDAKISSGLTKPFFFNWPKHAKEQAAKKPDITVMFIGGNDGFGFGDVNCCSKAWIKIYANHVSRMMSTYARGGAGQVYWCLLPAPRASNFRKVFVAVNKAIQIAVRRHPETAHLVDFPKTFTPGFKFSETLNGQVVRQDDGVHFNVAGASIAAGVIIRRMRHDGVI